MHSHNEQLKRRSQLFDDVVHSHQLLPFVHQLVQFVGQLGVSEELCTDTYRTQSAFSTSPSKRSMNVKHARKYCEFVTFTGDDGAQFLGLVMASALASSHLNLAKPTSK